MTSEDEKDLEPLYRAIEGYLRHARGTRANIAAAIFKKIEEAGPQAPKVLRRTAELFDDTGSDESVPVPSVFSETDLNNLKLQYAQMIDAFLSSVVMDDPPEDQFYASVWAFVENPIFTSDLKRAFALYWVLIDPQLPYYVLPRSNQQMSNDEYKARQENLRTLTNKIRLALYREYPQRTVQADIALGLVLSEKDAADRSVLMSALISYCRKLGAREDRGARSHNE